MPFSADVSPGSRYNHAAVTFPDKRNKGKPTVLVLGGLGETFYSMDLYFLTESETRSDVEWGKLIPYTKFEKIALDKASN